MGRFVRHGWCPHCGSRDAYAIYADDSAFCFSCHENDQQAYGGDGKGGYRKMAGELIPASELMFKAIEPRKILKGTCEAYGYAYGEHGGRKVQVAPYYHLGKLAAQHLRFPDKSFKWLGKAQHLELFGQRVHPPGSYQRVVITEGEVDALSVAQMFNLKTPVVSIPSGAGSAKESIGDNLEYLNSFPEIVLAFDNDGPGQEAVEKVLPLFKPGTVKLFNYPPGVKDANELLQAGKGQLIIDGVYKAVPWTPVGIVEGTELWADILADDIVGIDSPYHSLNEKLQGFRKGELYLFTAGSGIGKSTLVHEIAYHFMTKHQQKIGVFALEENKKRVGRRYCGIHLNKPITLSLHGTSTDDLEKAFKATVGSGLFWLYDHWGSVDLDGLLSKLRFLATARGVDWIVLDHISIVVSGLDEVAESERKLIDKLMTRLRSLIEETNVGVLAIVHLKRTDDGKGPSYNEGKTVRLTDLRGSGALEQLSDVVVSLERNQQGSNPDQSLIRVLKNRPVGRTGPADYLMFNQNTGRLLPEAVAALRETAF